MTDDSSRSSPLRFGRRRRRAGPPRRSRFRLRRREREAGPSVRSRFRLRGRDGWAGAGASRGSRFRRRRREGRMRALRPLLIGLAGLLLAGFLAWVVAFSSWLAASHVAVEGNSVVSSSQVRQAAEVPLGQPLIRVDLNAIKSRVERLPAVRSATVRRSWPRTVSIDVAERVQVAVMYRAGHWRAVDRNGVVFRVLSRRTPGYPQLVARRNDGALIGDAAAVAASLPATLAGEVKQIRARTADSIVLVLPRAKTIVWGSPGQSAEKARVAAALMRTKARTYDVSVPALPTTTR